MGSEFTDQTLITALVERQWAEEAQLQALLQTQQESLKTRQKQVKGLACLIDPRSGELLIQNHPGGEIHHRFSLHSGTAPEFKPEDYQLWGNHTFLAERNDGSRKAQFKDSLDQPYGLVAAHDFTYFYNGGNLDTAYLSVSHQALYPGMAKTPLQSGPFDLFISPDQQWLCVGNRGAGSVILFSTHPFKELGRVQIRQPGNHKALNIAIDDVNHRAYITDNQSATIYTLKFNDLSLSQNWTGLGNLGNLVLAPDHQHFYLLSLKPSVALHYMSMGSLRSSVELKGELFLDQGLAPCDLLALSPEGEHVLVMTSYAEPKAGTPLLTTIRIPQMKTLKRYTLKDGLKPKQLTYAFKNPLDFKLKPLEELVVEAELISAEDMAKLKAELLAPPPPEPEPEGPALRTSDVVQNNPDSDTLSLTPKKSKRIELPPETVTDIVEILRKLFEQQTGEDLSEQTEVLERLQEAAEKAREELEIFDSTIVQIDQLLRRHNLKTVLVREAIIRMQEARTDFEGDEIEPPKNCPNCDERLGGVWDCPACGFELESPERVKKRRIASAEATANLPHGHLVIPDPQGMRLLQLNPYKYISWNLDPDKVPGKSPYDTLWLPNNNILVADKDGNAVLEVGLQGTVYWNFDTQLSPEHALNEPVKATYFLPENTGERHYLIVDQGHHRVLETNARSELIRSFGTQGQAGTKPDHLCTPTDVQFTHERTYLIADTGNHRILEFDQRGQLLHELGAELELSSPTCIQRLFNGHTLVVDAGHSRLLELDAKGQLKNEVLYFSNAVDPAFAIVSPIKMIRLINQDILLMDEDKLIQVNLSSKKLVWFSKIGDLAFQPKVEAPTLVVDENGVEQLVYKVLEHGDLRPVRLSHKINFKRLQKLISARMQQEGSEEEESEEAKKERQLQALIADRMAESKRKLRSKLTTTNTIQPSQIFEGTGSGLKRMHIYTVDKHHNAVIRLNRKGEVGWHYGFEMGQVLSRPYHFLETPHVLWVADTGQNRVVAIAKENREIVCELKGPPMSLLGGPRALALLENDHVVIADQRNKRLVELNPQNEIVWEYNEDGKIRSPQYVEVLGNGHFLYADSMLNTVREIDRDGKCPWYYGTRLKGNGPGQLFAPEFATRLANGNTLIADTRNNRILEVSAEGREVWEYVEDPVSKRPILNPTHVRRLDNGNTLITFSNQRELLEVTPEKERVWYYKMGNDVFLPPVTGLKQNLKQEVDELETYYNPVEKRMIRSAETRQSQSLEAHVSLMDNVLMKSVRASLIMMILEQSGTVFKTFPSPEEILADKFGQQLIIAFTLDAGKKADQVAEDIRRVAEVAEASVSKIVLTEDNSSETEPPVSA